MTKIIGLTGGIGSGKTTVANYLAAKNIPVYIADLEARKISNSKAILKKITSVFGNQILVDDKLDRVAMAKIVFSDKEKLNKLNAIIHPAVKKHFENWVKKHQTYDFVVKETAILFESGSYLDCDIVILVTAPLETRIERTKLRDNCSRESVLQRISNQMPEDEKIKKSNFVIHNNSLEETYLQMDEVLKKLK